MYPHAIHLRGPWECEPLARTPPDERPLPPPMRMTMPCRWDEGGLGDFAGRVRFRRRFGYPGRIDDYERVWLTFSGVEGAAAIWLNGQLLGRPEDSSRPFEWEVTALLRPRNELVVEVDSALGGRFGEVALEIRCTAYLRGVQVQAIRAGPTVTLETRGEVVGTCDRTLELYVLVGRYTAAYTPVEADPAGRPFQVVAADLELEHWQAGPAGVRVELVNGASVWYSLEREVELS